MSRLTLDWEDLDRLQQSMKDFQGNTEEAINEVLHNEASPLIQESIKHLMPVSGRAWKGKTPPAKTSKSLTDEKGNLAITVKTTKKYQYLYFPNDGSNTRRHAGNQQFFERGAEAKRSEIVDRCVGRLVNNFEKAL